MPNIAGIAKLADGTPRATTPALGQHTADILRDHGFERSGNRSRSVERKVVSQA